MQPRMRASVKSILLELVAEYPPPPPERPGLKLVLHDPEVYVARTLFDMELIIDRLGTEITVLDLGGGFGLFSLGFARLGAKSILLDDFDWLLRADIGATIFDLFDRNNVQVVNRDLLLDKPLPSADAIGLFHVVEHLHNSPKSLFNRCIEALSPGGLFVVAVPNAQNLRKRIAAPFGKVKWSSMTDWYEQPVFRAHVREPDTNDLDYIAKDLNLKETAILGRNFLGMRSRSGAIRALSTASDGVLRRRPSLCSDLYLVGQKGSAESATNEA